MKIKVTPILRTDIATRTAEKRIDLQVLCQGRRTKLPTPHHARPADWDKRKGRIKGMSGYAIAVNAQLAEKIADFDRFFANRMVEGTAADITTNDIRALLGNKPIAEKPAQKRKDATIEEIFDRYIDFIKATDKRGNTIRNYGTNKRTICGFARARYGQLVTVRDINLSFVTELLKHLRDERKNNNGTIAKRLEGLRAVIRYAIHEGYDVEDPFGRYSNIIPSGTSHKTVFLDAEEYTRFCDLRLPADAAHAMRLAHTMFIFSCETGLRYSDMQDLRWEHLLMDDKGRYTALEKVQVKTSHTVHVPLSDCALAIVCMNEHNRKGEYVFDRIANQTLNDQLKIIARQAGIAKSLSYHVSRHTFATNLAKHNVTQFDILQLLGDSNPAMAQVYVNADAHSLKQTMQNVWGKQRVVS